MLITQDMTQLLDTVARFVEQGGTLTFDAKPEPPLGIDRIDYLTSPGADLVERARPDGDAVALDDHFLPAKWGQRLALRPRSRVAPSSGNGGVMGRAGLP